MILAGMVAEDEDALICDLAETYQIYDHKQLPLSKVAVFARGLRDDSRIKMKLSGQTVPLDTLLSAGAVDRLSLLVWMQTKDGQKGIKRPGLLAPVLAGNEKRKEDFIAFSSGKEFEEMREKIIQNIKEGGNG
ncbi:MAG: DUF5361 domain-containing protein [Peptostreptococcaceae bacterium]|nr:DUF5361 domain-containing protein [Peptostreptococcaceae bacterium]